jgi:hypothetical protein
MRAARASALSASRAEATRDGGAAGNVATGKRLTSRDHVDIAAPHYRKASAGEPLFVTMHAGRPHGGRMAFYKRHGLPNYRGQNPRFMRLFHRKKRRYVVRAIRVPFRASQGKWRNEPGTQTNR